MYRVSIELYKLNTSGSLGEQEMLWEHRASLNITLCEVSSLYKDDDDDDDDDYYYSFKSGLKRLHSRCS